MADKTIHRFQDPFGKFGDGPSNPTANLNSKRATASYAKQLYATLASGPIAADSEIIRLRELLRRAGQANDKKGEAELNKQLKDAEGRFKEMEKNARMVAANSAAQLEFFQEIEGQIAEIQRQLTSKSNKGNKAMVAGLQEVLKRLETIRDAATGAPTDFFEGLGDAFKEVMDVLNKLPGEVKQEIAELDKSLDQAFEEMNTNLEDTKDAVKKVGADVLDVQKQAEKDEADKAKELQRIQRKEAFVATQDKEKGRNKAKKQKREEDFLGKFSRNVERAQDDAKRTIDEWDKRIADIRATVEKGFLRVADRLGIGFVNLGNLYRAGKSIGKGALEVGRFIKDPREYVSKSRPVQAIRGMAKGLNKYAEARSVAGGGGVHKILDTMLNERNKGTDQDPYAVKQAALTGKRLDRGVDMDTMMAHITKQLGDKQAGGYENEEDEKESKALEALLKDYIGSAKSSNRRITRAVEKSAAHAGDNSSGGIIGALSEGLGGLGKTLGGFVGEGGILKTIASSLSGFAGLLVPIISTVGGALLAAGVFVAAWKVGKWLYDKFLGDNPLFQNITDKIIDFVTGGNAKGEGITDTPEQAAAKAQAIQASSMAAVTSDPMGGNTGGGYEAQTPAPTDSGGKVVVKAMQGAGAALADAGKSAVAGASNVVSSTNKVVGDTVSAVAASPMGQAVTSVATPMIAPVIQGATMLKKGTQKIADFIGKTFSAGGNVKTEGVNASVQDNFVKMADEYKQVTGKKLSLNSAFRTPEDQANVNSGGNLKASSGGSWHQYGMALDVNRSQVNELKQLGLLQKYGFTQPFPDKDPVHIQPFNIPLNPKMAGISGDVGRTQMAAASMPTSNFNLPEAKPANQQAVGATQAGATQSTGGGTMGPSPKNGVSTIPTFDHDAGLLLAINVGMFT